jgi:hypothetical protein
LASGSKWGGAEVRGGGDGERGLKSAMDPPCSIIPSPEKETENAITGSISSYFLKCIAIHYSLLHTIISSEIQKQVCDIEIYQLEAWSKPFADVQILITKSKDDQ